MAVQQYAGGCQCGAVRFEVTMELDEVLACNCSRCGRLGSLLAFAPASHFKLLSGEGKTTTYKFNKHAIDHMFCTTCGIQSFARGKTPNGEMVAVNARCLDDVDPLALKVKFVDGKRY